MVTVDDARRYVSGNASLLRALGAQSAHDFSLRPLGHGEHNDNFALELAEGRSFVLRANVVLQPFHKNQVAYEFAALKALEPSGRTPRALFLDDSPAALAHGVIVEGLCPGVELDFDNLRPGDLEAVARALADVHSVPVADDCPLYQPADPLAGLFDECLDRYRFYLGSAYTEERITRRMDRFAKACGDAIDVAPSPSASRHIVNTETLASHFLIDREGFAGGVPRASFIDWERPILGEVAQDVAYFTEPTTTLWDSDYAFDSEGATRFADAYWQAVGGRFGAEGFAARYRAWAMVTAFRSQTWCCRALVYQRAGDTSAYATEKARTKVPRYLSDDFFEMIERLYL